MEMKTWAVVMVLGAGIVLSGCGSVGDSATEVTGVEEVVRCSHRELLREAAGQDAVDCGFAHPNQDYFPDELEADRALAGSCVERAMGEGKAFYVRFWISGAGHQAVLGYFSSGNGLVRTQHEVFYSGGAYYEGIVRAECDQPTMVDESQRWEYERELFDCAPREIAATPMCQSSGARPPELY
jgi:hypothetical protein